MTEADVIDLGEFRLRRVGSRHYAIGDECKHRHVSLHEFGDVVTCNDCKMQVGAFWLLTQICSSLHLERQRLKDAEARLQHNTQAVIHLIAARAVERAWRSRNMEPTCPHCHAAIFPADGFGRSSMNRKLALARRAALKAKEGG